jgi:DNA-directed RNA polymerase subunit RPC12/RpoP
MTMAKRQCLKCGGELVTAFRPSGNAVLTGSPKGSSKPFEKWRCSTCGNAFTTEQLRADKRTNSQAVERG